MRLQNYITLEGRLTREPEVNESKSGCIYCKFGICYNENKKSVEKDGKVTWDSIPHFFNCVAFGSCAEDVGKMAKGELVSVAGKVSYSHWVQNGTSRSSTSIEAQSVKKIVYEKKNKDYVPNLKKASDIVNKEPVLYKQPILF